ncbi:hypothetical protein [Cesiribacter andamanensis]|uniref:Lipoprotein n=1 Tax=Cesiribacter andamanensis AMV16 TaxID=1279009 RepID=M7N7Z9_9BACT|nr:hypothetical protein [Cesiribacter andamanensis]EMR03377.1 hypothetical protein ADICEAN_01481 [Cesiribacter andamanensis AMV16]
MHLFKSSLLLAAALLAFVACDRQDPELDQAEATSAMGEAESSALYDDLDVMTAEAVSSAEAEGERQLSSLSAIPACATVSRNADTRTIVLDFGSGCTDARGVVRSGKVIIARTGRYFQPGSTITTTLEDYTVNGIALEGTRTLSNITSSSTASPQFSVSLSGGKATWPDGSSAEREVSHIRTWIRATNPLNDEWHISGTASGRNRQGQEYASTITEELVIKLSCMSEGVFAPSSGVQLITRPNKATLTLDWGAGSCDRSLVVSMNGRSRTITLGR